MITVNCPVKQLLNDGHIVKWYIFQIINLSLTKNMLVKAVSKVNLCFGLLSVNKGTVEL